jgi:putative transposase
VKDAWIDAQRRAFDLAARCAVLAVSISGDRAWKGGGHPERRWLTDPQMRVLIQSIQAQFKGAYGRPRRVRERRSRGFPARKTRVERRMRAHGIRARHQRRDKVTTEPKHTLPVADNLLTRDFAPVAPNQVWTADITDLWTDDGWLDLAIVLDLFNREVVGWSLKPRMTADLVTDALTMAWFRRQPAPGLIHPSDRGSQDASHAVQDKRREDGMVCSMSRKGNGWDNAPTESWFNRFQNERVFGERFATREAMTTMTFEYIDVFYNRKRLHSTLGDTSPVSFLNDWRSTQQDQKQVA